MDAHKGTITLIGSGEFGEGMARVYRSILARAPEPPSAVFLDTPAGFELNADAISAKASDYFAQRLNVELHCASFKNQARASALDVQNALGLLRRADLIFAGPGSPTYAVRNWSGTPIWDAVRDRFQAGAHLVFASAAAITVGICVLPVYEIYKAGHDIFWQHGLNLLGLLGMHAAVVPHWNNAEGGTYDTRRCYMGETRFQTLEDLLPPGTVIIGIDEYTACVLDAASETCSVMGSGSVTIRRAGREQIFSAGQTFGFGDLQTGAVELPVLSHAGLGAEGDTGSTTHSDETARYLFHLAQALDEVQEPELKRDLMAQAHDTMHEFAEHASDGADARMGDIAPFVNFLVRLRTELRAAKQFKQADEIRTELTALGIELQDTANGTTWGKI